MKTKLTFIVLISISFLSTNAQITLDHVFNNQRVDMVTLEHVGPKYYEYDYAAHTAALLNLDYSIYKTIQFPHVPCITYTVGLITENLFDTDSTTLEYMLSFNDSFNAGFRIYREDSTLLFQADSGAIIYANEYSIHNNIPYVPIFNTDSGTKMIVVNSPSGIYTTSIYNLPGKLSETCCSKPLSTSVAQLYNKQKRIGNYPNPFKESTVIEYSLPAGTEYAELSLLNESGEIIKKYKLLSSQNKFELISTDLEAGTYFYQISTSNGEVLSQKMIKLN